MITSLFAVYMTSAVIAAKVPSLKVHVPKAAHAHHLPRVHGLGAAKTTTRTKGNLAGADSFMSYVLLAVCPRTKAWWIFHRRYSHFHALRKELVTLRRLCQPVAGLQCLLRALDGALTAAFPRKRLLVTVTSPTVVAERLHSLQLFAAQLTLLRAVCSTEETKGLTHEALGILHHIGALMDSFLQAPAHLRHLRNTEGLFKASSKDDCSICLEPVGSDWSSPTLVLPCHHRFHELCLAKWFETEPTCPLCRATATHGTVA
ncbi:hypothetical protein ACHHYP_20852 [Achlya hypogyna]|uniref:RING-type domain-containing protein n=1 Tax=Achlya hypogyna TaxID=1202772 RepID=A0A1V9Y578_ACHHY|nr:hypothetical protein ACHHYP_20852 [Achlya hypogyna]